MSRTAFHLYWLSFVQYCGKKKSKESEARPPRIKKKKKEQRWSGEKFAQRQTDFDMPAGLFAIDGHRSIFQIKRARLQDGGKDWILFYMLLLTRRLLLRPSLVLFLRGIDIRICCRKLRRITQQELVKLLRSASRALPSSPPSLRIT